MLGDLRSVKTASSLERRKKTSIKGVLDKRDLAEVYNCDTKKGWKKRSSVSSLPAIEHQLKVNSVDFKEATIEDLLPSADMRRSEGRNHLKQQEAGKNFYEAVRRVSHVELTATSQTIKKSLSQTNELLVENTNNSVTPSGYEPENSLRRASVATRPRQLQLEGGLRRRSALDRPHAFSKQQESVTSTNKSSTAETAYEPENSLLRRRKVSDNSKSAQGRARNRRVGVVLEQPMDDETQQQSEHERSPNKTILSHLDQSPGINSSPERSPIIPRSSSRKILTTLSIPEDEEVRGNCALNTPSPRHQRKVSQRLPNFANSQTMTAVTANLSSPKIERKYSSPSLNTSPTSPIKLRITPSSPSLDIQTATNAIKARRSSTSALPSLVTSSRSTSLNRTKKANVGDPKRVRKDEGLSVERQMSSKRYWESYLLQVSYSWQSFNTHSHYCY